MTYDRTAQTFADCTSRVASNLAGVASHIAREKDPQVLAMLMHGVAEVLEREARNLREACDKVDRRSR